MAKAAINLTTISSSAIFRKIINQKLNELTQARKTERMALFNQAKIFAELVQIPWEITEYEYFSKFIKAEITKYTVGTVYAYITMYKHIAKFNYTDKELFTIFEVHNLTHLSNYLAKVKRKPTVKQLLSKNIRLIISKKHTRINVNNFSTWLSEEHLNKLHGILINYGMTISSDGRKQGIREATEALIDTLV